MNDLKSITLIKLGKNPIIGKWQNHTNWTIWNKNIKANIGILTGISTKQYAHNNNITVIDIVSNKKNNDLLKLMQSLNTFTVKTNNNLYFYFQYEQLNNKLDGDIKIFNNGMYVVAPNSIVKNDKYEIINDNEPKQMSSKLKQILRKLDNKPIIEKKKQDNKQLHGGLDYWFKKPEQIINKLPNKYFEEIELFTKVTGYCKLFNLKDLWDTKKLCNDKLWENSIILDEDIDELVNNSIGSNHIYYKLKNIPEQTCKPDIIINRKKLGYTFIDDIIEKNKNINCIVVKSDTGTGKTTSFSSYIEKNKYNFLSLVSRVSLGAEQYENVFTKNGLKCEFYHNTNKKFITGENVVIQIESLMRLSRIDVSEYVIFLDELNSLLEHLITSSTLDKHRVLIFLALEKIVREAKLIIGVDADISDIVFDFLKLCGRKTLFIKNIYKHNDGVKSSEINDMEILIGEIKQLNKYIVCCDSKSEVDKLYKRLDDYNIKVFTSDTEMASCSLDDFDKIIYSPKILYGLDSTMVRPVYCIYTNLTISPKQMLQQIARTRNISYLKYIFLRKTFIEPRYKSLEECYNYLKDSNNDTIELFHLIKSSFTGFYLRILSKIEYKNDCYNVNKFCHFKKLLNSRGFKDKTKYFNETIVDKVIDKEIKEKIKEERIENYKKYAPKINEYLKIPEDKLHNYKELIVDKYILLKHLNIRKFFFKITTIGLIKDYVKYNINDYACNISKGNESKMLFLRNLLNKSQNSIDQDNFKPDHGLNKNDAEQMIKTYNITFRDRTKKVFDLTKLTDVQDILKKCYSNLFGQIITTKRKGSRNNKETNYTTVFDIDHELFEYHKTIINYSLQEEIKDEDITFIDYF